MELGAIGSVAAANVQRNLDTGQIGNAVPASSTTSQAAAVQTTNAVRQAAASPSLDQVKQAVDTINQSMNALSRGLQFSVDKDSQRTVVKIVDQQTDEVIRQIPSEEALAIAKSLDQALGRLIKEKA
ncbi:MAG: flagellar protein FlaG [Burkholderiaceae bacterium]|nr:flagellar protein FlaG [Burkholderiaceae bacterium]